MDQMQAAVQRYDRRAEDVGNIIEFGHVNVRVPDQSLATLFYVAGLGLTRDPFLMTGTDNMWINVGTSQFHLPSGPAQVVRGTIGLVLPDLDALRRRLARVRQKLSGTRFSVIDHGATVEAVCPWGNRIVCHAPDAAAFGPVVLGIVYVALDAPPGSAAPIARFYREVLGAPAQLDGDSVRVGVGADTVLIYRETAAAMPAYDGHHVQISLADFSGPHGRLLARGLISEESDQHQYRFQAMTDLDTGATLMEVEHEVRSMRHPLFARLLVNRNPEVSNLRYAPGHDAAAWSLLAGGR